MSKQRVLVIDDELDLIRAVVKILEPRGYVVLEAACGQEGLEKVNKSRPDIVLLDWQLPDIDGIDLCKKLKDDERTSEIPIIMLTVKSSEDHVVLGLGVGADDYISKPYSPRILLARIEALLRRSGNKKEKVIKAGKICLDLDRHAAYILDQPVVLTPKEFDLLFILMRRKNHAFSRETLVESVWGYEYFNTSRTLDTHIKQLRKKLGKEGKKIETVESIGYRFVDEE